MTMEDDTTEDEELTFTDMMELAESTIEMENEEFDGEIPKHAGRLISMRAKDLLGTLVNIDVSKADEGIEDPSEEQVQQALAEDAVEILLALGALRYEYDLDIEEAFRERKELIEVVQNADSQQEIIDELFDGDVEGMMGGVDVGQNVDDEGYDGEPGPAFA